MKLPYLLTAISYLLVAAPGPARADDEGLDDYVSAITPRWSPVRIFRALAATIPASNP